ncbi:FAD-binding oxidoreductase [Streptococcus catagoni]|uniref:FAD-binding oxidoreductase n=1 Tax=Streptococcus catagoni TaxID=2654874 RepID=UPI00140B8B5A|nr:FAD-binding oxidoreductase [Streptococcus catagoni]
MTKKLITPFGLSWLMVLFLLPLPFLYTLKTGLPAIYTNRSLGILLGALAYVWMLTAIYIATKPKWLDRLIGLPSAYMIHGMLSLIALLVAFIHKELDSSQAFIKWTGDVAFVIFLGLAAYSLLFLAGWLTSRIPLLLSIKQFLEKIFKHEISVWLHRLNLLATLLIFIHIHLIDYIVSIKAFMFLIWAYTFFVLFSYLFFHFNPRAHGIRANVLDNREVAANIRQLSIQLPRKPRLRLQPGDFAFLSFPEISGMAEPHPFSILNNPKDTNILEFAIRGDGDFTRQLTKINSGTSVRVDGGYGHYQKLISKFKPDQLFIIGGGIGVVPLFSIIEGNPQIDTVFYYTVKNQEGLLYQDRLASWQKRSNFRAYYQVGRYNDDYILSQLPEKESNFLILLGGPISMGRHWRSFFIAQGIDPERIYFEEFLW